MYRQLSKVETEILEKQGCKAENWFDIEVKLAFTPEKIRNVHFSGKVKLGILEGLVEVEPGIKKPSSIKNCFIQHCTIGDNVYLSEIKTLANYSIEDYVAIENVGALVVTGKTAFGNGFEIEVLNEAGGRELPVFDKLSAQLAYLVVLYRHNKKLVNSLKKLIASYVVSKNADTGVIGQYSRIVHAKSLINVMVGENTTIYGSSLLKEGTISSSKIAPVVIGQGVIAENFIVLSGSKVESGAMLSRTFIGQGVRIGKQFSAENSAFFANCEGFHGEACSVLAGPYTVTHHKSTLLIAGMFSFYNAGSGTNQSNHMYKLGPVHQGIVERGCKTGSFSYLLWPCRVGAFSVVMDKHAGNFDTSELPFSYITVENGKSVATPAMNLFTVGTARDAAKWPNRDRRTDGEKLDLITFDLLNPFTVQKIIQGSSLLRDLHERTPKNREFASRNGIHINRLMLRTAKRYYDLAIHVYLSETLVNKIRQTSVDSMNEIRKTLANFDKSGQSKWIDVFGLVTTQDSVETLVNDIADGNIYSLDKLYSTLESVQNRYRQLAYSWCAGAAKEHLSFDAENFTKQELTDLVIKLKENAVKFKSMVLKDAEKEFDQHSRIGFGVDGTEEDVKSDFEFIRGTYESNKFVQTLKKEILEIESESERLVNQLEKLTG